MFDTLLLSWEKRSGDEADCLIRVPIVIGRGMRCITYSRKGLGMRWIEREVIDELKA